MTGFDRWIFGVFGRILVLRWARRIFTLAVLTAVVFGGMACLYGDKFLLYPPIPPIRMMRIAIASFGVAALSLWAAAFAMRRVKA